MGIFSQECDIHIRTGRITVLYLNNMPPVTMKAGIMQTAESAAERCIINPTHVLLHEPRDSLPEELYFRNSHPRQVT